MSLALYTFADEAYVPAVVSLINSARGIGFRGPIHVGSPEPLSIALQSHEGVTFHVMGQSMYWPGNRKAELILAHPSDYFVFLDADVIVSHCSFFDRMERLIEFGPVCSVETIIPSIDSRRHMWAKRLGRVSRPQEWPDCYFNSGLFAGVFKRDQPLIEAWHSGIRNVLSPPGDLLTDPDFQYADQDVLNAVLQDWEPQPIGIGPPDVWYSDGFRYNSDAPILLHCIDRPKPWRIRRLPSYSPSIYDLAWYEHVVAKPEPIRITMEMPFVVRVWFERRALAHLLRIMRWVARRVLGK